jgi:hypothetical protein
LQGLAGGTLLYITFYEVLDKDKLSKLGMNGLGGCFLLILGFSVMAGLEAAGTFSIGILTTIKRANAFDDHLNVVTS